MYVFKNQNCLSPIFLQWQRLEALQLLLLLITLQMPLAKSWHCSINVYWSDTGKTNLSSWCLAYCCIKTRQNTHTHTQSLHHLISCDWALSVLSRFSSWWHFVGLTMVTFALLLCRGFSYNWNIWGGPTAVLSIFLRHEKMCELVGWLSVYEIPPRYALDDMKTRSQGDRNTTWQFS